MTKQPFVSRQSQGDWLHVLGMEVKFLCKGKDSGGRFSAMLNTVPKGTGAPRHSHPWDEGYYILSGSVQFTLGDESHVLNAGDFACAPAGTVHSFEGVSESDGMMLIIDSPCHSNAFFEEIHEKINTIPDDLPEMVGIGERHKVIFAPG